MTSPATGTPTNENKKPGKRRVSFEALVTAIQDACTWSVDSLDSDDAEALADEIVDLVIAVLRRELPQRSLQEWTLTLADLRQQIAWLLAREFDRNAANGDDLAERIVAELVNNDD
jgi:hypothetical protein